MYAKIKMIYKVQRDSKTYTVTYLASLMKCAEVASYFYFYSEQKCLMAVKSEVLMALTYKQKS